MKSFISGLVIGIVIATSVGIAAQDYKTYASVKWALNNTSDEIRLGYVAGVSDTLSALTALQQYPGGIDWEKTKRLNGCLDLRGKSLGMLREFAEATWRGDQYKEGSAALSLMAYACDK